MWHFLVNFLIRCDQFIQCKRHSDDYQPVCPRQNASNSARIFDVLSTTHFLRVCSFRVVHFHKMLFALINKRSSLDRSFRPFVVSASKGKILEPSRAYHCVFYQSVTTNMIHKRSLVVPVLITGNHSGNYSSQQCHPYDSNAFNTHSLPTGKTAFCLTTHKGGFWFSWIWALKIWRYFKPIRIFLTNFGSIYAYISIPLSSF